MSVELQGIISGTLFRNSENGWSVVEIRSKGELTTVVGHLPELSSGESCVFSGDWVEHPQYGRQLKASACHIQAPDSLKGIERYLGSGLIKGIGPSTARLIVEAFGDKTLEILSEAPQRLREISGIGKIRSRQIAESYQQQFSLRKSMIFLQSYDLPIGLSEKISKKYKERAEEIVRHNPYQLIQDIDGIGFLTADRIALTLGFPENSDNRMREGLKYVLSESSLSYGHSYVPREELLTRASLLLRCHTELLEPCLCGLILSKELHSEFIQGQEAIFSPDAYRCEWSIAKKLNLLNNFSQQMMLEHVTAQVKEFEGKNRISFSPTQQKAIVQATQNGVLIITGGPGTGKTTLINCMIHVLGNDENILLAAPTGRAAKRMSDATGKEAKTIHRLLEFSGEFGGFVRNDENPLDCSCLIVDEVSMVDIFLMRSLLRAVKIGTRLIMVGDKDQLPSVGPGNVLGDMLDSATIAQVRLTEIFRQDEKSMIIENAHRINHGLMPLLNTKQGDFFFERSSSPEDAAKIIVDLCLRRLPLFLKEDQSRKMIQVLSPTKKGACGVHQLNLLLQAALNPPTADEEEMHFGETVFRCRDKVIHTRNNYLLEWRSITNGETGQGVFNGDVGYILDIDKEGRMLTVLYDDERAVDYEYAKLEELELAYCLSVHKSQGSEFEAVVMPAVGGHPLLLNRNLFYTAVTRARKLVVLVGYEHAIQAMVSNNRSRKRYTALDSRLSEVRFANYS